MAASRLAYVIAVCATMVLAAAAQVELRPFRTHHHRHRPASSSAASSTTTLPLVQGMPLRRIELSWVFDSTPSQTQTDTGTREREDGAVSAARVSLAGNEHSASLSSALRGCRQQSAVVEMVRVATGYIADEEQDEHVATAEVLNAEQSVVLFTLSLEALQPGTVYAWRVAANVTCASGSPGPNAAPLRSPWTPFRTRLAAFDAGAQWVGGFNELSSAVTLRSDVAVQRATAYVSAVGAFYLYLNGQQVGDHIMDPGQGVYPTRVKYLAFELNTTALQQGGSPNTFRATIGNYKWGYLDVWCNVTAAGGPDGCRALIFQLNVEYADGSNATFCSNTTTWTGQHGAIVYDHLYHGEIYDARVAQRNAAAASGTAVVQMHPAVGVLIPQLIEPIRIVKTITAQAVVRLDSGCPGTTLGGVVQESDTLELACVPGSGNISQIVFASYGTPRGTCPSYVVDPACNASVSAQVVASLCLGRTACSISASNTVFGGDPCPNTLKYLAVAASGCKPAPAVHRNISWVFDFGVNMAGTTRLAVQGLPAETTVVIRHGETRSADGHVQNIFYPPGSDCSMAAWYANKWDECANQTNAFISAGTGGSESYTPSFTYQGFRFAEIFGLPPDYPVTSATLVALQQGSDLVQTGTLQLAAVPSAPSGNTSDILNRIAAATVNAQAAQLWSVPTDCPTREKRGWMGDAHMSANEFAFNFDCRQFHRSFLQSIRDDQVRGCQYNPLTDRDAPCGDPVLQNGSVPDVTPFTTGPYGANPGSPVWQSALVVIAHNLWRHYADREALQELYPGLRLFIDYLHRNADPNTGLVLFGGLGDWVPPGGNSHNPTPTNSVSAFYWLYDLRLMVDIAQALGETSDAAYYQTLLANSTLAYHAYFFNSTTAGYSQGSQCSNLMALQAGVPPTPAVAKAAADALLYSIVTANSKHLNVGIVGTTFVFDVLTRLGQASVALDVLLEDSYPSFGYMVAQNATTLWEAWEGTATQQVSSRNHIMFGGGVGAFVYSALGGLDTVSNATCSGWQHVKVGPAAAAAARLPDGKASVVSRFGVNAVNWRAGADAPFFQLNATVPIGAAATIKITLLHNATTVREGAAVVWQNGAFVPHASAGLVSARAALEEGFPTVLFEANSGKYTLVVE